MKKIKRAEATYTGGGTYIFTGQTADGGFFMGADDWGTYDYIIFLDSDPYKDFDDSAYIEWQEEHKTAEISGSEAENFFVEIIKKCIDELNKGSRMNASVEDMENILERIENGEAMNRKEVVAEMGAKIRDFVNGVFCSYQEKFGIADLGIDSDLTEKIRESSNNLAVAMFDSLLFQKNMNDCEEFFRDLLSK